MPTLESMQYERAILKAIRERTSYEGIVMAQCSDAPMSVPPPADEKIQAIYDAQQYIKDYEQWVMDHPGKTPPQEMTNRYKQEQLFVAKNFRL